MKLRILFLAFAFTQEVPDPCSVARDTVDALYDAVKPETGHACGCNHLVRTGKLWNVYMCDAQKQRTSVETAVGLCCSDCRQACPRGLGGVR